MPTLICKSCDATTNNVCSNTIPTSDGLQLMAIGCVMHHLKIRNGLWVMPLIQQLITTRLTQ